MQTLASAEAGLPFVFFDFDAFVPPVVSADPSGVVGVAVGSDRVAYGTVLAGREGSVLAGREAVATATSDLA